MLCAMKWHEAKKKTGKNRKHIWSINDWIQPVFHLLPYAQTNEHTLPQVNKQQCWICSSLVPPQAVWYLMNSMTEVHLMHSEIVIYGNINHRLGNSFPYIPYCLSHDICTVRQNSFPDMLLYLHGIGILWVVTCWDRCHFNTQNLYCALITP